MGICESYAGCSSLDVVSVSMPSLERLLACGIRGKRIVLRLDLNVPLRNGRVGDFYRLEESLQTLKALKSGGGRVKILSHFGRPGGRVVESYSFKRLLGDFQSWFGQHGLLLEGDFSTKYYVEAKKEPGAGKFLLLENVRFCAEEEAVAPGESFVKKALTLGEVFVHEGFSVSHRNSVSSLQLAKHLPSYSGYHLEREVRIIKKLLLDRPKHPFFAIIGGKKASKFGTLKTFLSRGAKVVLGGGIANTFLAAHGYNIGNSFVEEDLIPRARELLRQYATTLTLPDHVLVCKSLREEGTLIKCKSVSDLAPDDIIGDACFDWSFLHELRPGGTVFWNGPLGICENPSFTLSSHLLYTYLKGLGAKVISIIGGGDTMGSLPGDFSPSNDSISHYSTGGGALLAFLENPHLEVLRALKLLSC